MLNFPSDPVLLHSPDGRRSKHIPAIDAQGWINAGWSLTAIERIVAVPMVVKTEVMNPPLDPLLEDQTPPIDPISQTENKKPETKKK